MNTLTNDQWIKLGMKYWEMNNKIREIQALADGNFGPRSLISRRIYKIENQYTEIRVFLDSTICSAYQSDYLPNSNIPTTWVFFNHSYLPKPRWYHLDIEYKKNDKTIRPKSFTQKHYDKICFDCKDFKKLLGETESILGDNKYTDKMLSMIDEFEEIMDNLEIRDEKYYDEIIHSQFII